MDFQHTWYLHWYWGDLVRDCKWVNFVNFWQKLSARYTCISVSVRFWVNINGFSPKIVCTFILCWSGLWLLMVKFHLFDRFICPLHDSGGVLSFHVYILKSYQPVEENWNIPADRFVYTSVISHYTFTVLPRRYSQMHCTYILNFPQFWSIY